MNILFWAILVVLGMLAGWAVLDYLHYKRKRTKSPSEIIGYDDATGKPITRNELLKSLNIAAKEFADEIDKADKKFSGNSHDRRVQRRAHGRQEKTPLS